MNPPARTLLPSAVILAVTFCVVLFFSINSVWMGDDILYQYRFLPEKQAFGNDSISFGEPVRTLGDLAESQYHHYLRQNGRCVAHIMVQTFCALCDKTTFAVFNALVYVAFILLISSFAPRGERNYKVVWTAAIMVFASIRLPMTPVFQINYVWTSALVLGFLRLFILHRSTRNPLALTGLGIYSVIAGNCHEGINSGICIALIVFWLANFRRYTIAAYIMSIGFGIGALFLCLSPGNFQRLDTSEGSSWLQAAFTFMISARAIYLLAAVVLYNRFRFGMSFRNMMSTNRYLWIAFAVSVAFAFMTGMKNNRPLLGAEIIAIVLTLRLLHRYSLGILPLLALSVYILVYWVGQFRRESVIREQYAEICEQYPDSPTGEVYTSVQMLPKDGLMDSYVEDIPLAAPHGWTQIAFQKHMLELYGREKAPIRVLPDYLLGKDSMELDNSIVPYGDGVFLLIQSKTAPQQFVVDRSFKILGLNIKQYEPLTISFNEPSKETEKWRAIVVNESLFAVRNLTETKFRIEKDN